MAEGSTLSTGTGKCRRSDCMTCPNLVLSDEFKSNVTARIFKTKNETEKKITCKLQNYIYLLTCHHCNVQYVGESILPLHQRINIHRRAKSGCQLFIRHFKDVCPGATFSIQIIEVLPGSGYKNGKMDLEIARYRKDREDFWMKEMRAVYPYGLCKKVKHKGTPTDAPTGVLFPPLPRHGERGKGLTITTRNGSRAVHNEAELFEYLEIIGTMDRANECRKYLDRLKRTSLKRIADDIVEILPHSTSNELRWREYVLDIIQTKFYKKDTNSSKKSAPKFMLKMRFKNKGLDAIKLGNILRKTSIRETLPECLNDDAFLPSIVYSLEPTIRNKIFNYKDVVSNIDINDNISYGTGLTSCDCSTSVFCNRDHGHILTGDLRIIANDKIRKLISRGPNYREPRTLNWKHCRDEIKNSIEEYISKILSSCKDVTGQDMIAWKNKLLEEVDNAVKHNKCRLKSQHTNPVLRQEDCVNYLKSFHEKFVVVPIDKASNNVAIVCKRYYAEVILKEIGIIGNTNNTYEKANKTKDEIIQDNVQYAEHLGFNVSEREKDLPNMYWIPKMHKNPVKHRFIVASKACSTKPISKAVSNAFKLIHRQTERFHSSSKYDANFNKFWVVQNSQPVLNALNKINAKKNAKCISTFDFSTLYTKIPHDKLIEKLDEVIDQTFAGGNRNYLSFSCNGTSYWSSGKKKPSFSQNSLKLATKHLITNCYFTVGNTVMRQVVGIPMGIDPAPFWANLFLYKYEHQYIKNLIKNNRIKAKHFHSTFRFIDDLCAINDGAEFSRVFKEIYPDELELEVEHQGDSATFLNLDVNIANNQFVYKLYDKRDAFPFSIVRMPYHSSNIPSKIFYSALVGEFLRIARSTLKVEDFVPKAKTLIARMSAQGGNSLNMKRWVLKIMDRHPDSFKQFHTNLVELLNTCF